MVDVTKLARDKPCTIRLPGCDGGGSTTVPCHYRMLPYNGTGVKPTDLWVAWGCRNCHDLVDERVRSDFSREYLKLAHLEGVLRTLNFLEEDGHLALSQKPR